MHRDRVILGMGTGRSGTLSLATILHQQGDASFSHELTSFQGRRQLSPRGDIACLPWSVDIQAAYATLHAVLGYPGRYVGDVAWFWLPYVEPLVQDREYDFRVVCLERSREEVVDSFLRKTDRPSGSKNHWMVHDGITWRKDPRRDPCFPKYDVVTKREAIGAYWDEYHASSARLASVYPDSVRVWSVDALNSRAGLREILDFVEIAPSDRVLRVDGFRNRSQRSLRQYGKVLTTRLRSRQRGAED